MVAWLTAAMVRDKRVLEVGSRDVNGSPRPQLASLQPAAYVGVDLSEGPGVDLICSASELVERLGAASFDVVISTEMLEHCADWQLAVQQMSAVLRPGGWLLVTTRSPGFFRHEHPDDHWRFRIEDFERIFAGWEEPRIESDAQAPGVFFLGRRPPEPAALPALRQIAVGASPPA
ncbi:MAG: class I SAM-dependent methyltransferase [Candidatus Dormibacteria bacterium]